MAAVTASLCSALLFVSVSVSIDNLMTSTSMTYPGQDTTLSCRAPNNNITAVKWSRADLESEYVLLYRDGQIVPDNQHPSFKNRVDLQDRRVTKGDISLILRDVRTADSGRYKCLVFMRETHSWEPSITYLSVLPEKDIITAESGQNVTLTCKIPDKITAVKWSRTDPEPERVLLYRDFIPDEPNQSYNYWAALQDREMKIGNATLILQDVTINDTGTYECHVFVGETRSWLSTIIYLTVHPPGRKSIRAKSGQNVTLTCGAPNNNTDVKWSRADLETEYVLLYQDGNFNPDNQHPSFKNRVNLQDRQMKDGNASLILQDVTINDTGAYECRVFMTEKPSWQLSSIIYLTVDAPDTIITSVVLFGNRFSLRCQNPYNSKGVKWTKTELEPEYVVLYQDGQFDPNRQHPSFKNRVDLQDRRMKDGDVSLVLEDLNTADTGTYECRVFRTFSEIYEWELIRIVHLIVHPEQKTITADPGHNVTLPCRAINNNTGVKWIRADLETERVLLYQDGTFDPDEQHPSFKNRVDLQDRQMRFSGISLILKNVNTDDSGTYECRVFMGATRSWMLRSIVYLTVDPPAQKIITVESGQNVTLTCRAPNNQNTAVKWTISDLQTQSDLLYRTQNFDLTNQHPLFRNRMDLQDRQMKDGDASLILKNVTTADNGTYKCRVLMEETHSWKLSSIIYLQVLPGQPGGRTGDAEVKDGSVGLKVGLSALALVLVAAVGFVIYRKHKQDSYAASAVPTDDL